MTKLSDTAKENLKVKFRDLMICTMDFCIESVETKNASTEIFKTISQDIKRELTEKEISRIMLWAEPIVKTLSYCNNQKEKDKTYNEYFAIMEGEING